MLLNRGRVAPESLTYPDLAVVDSVFDVVSDTVTSVLTSSESGIIEVQQLMKSGQAVVLASFSSPESTLLSFAHFVDSASLVFVFENGDIISANYDASAPDCETTSVEIVGLIDTGIYTASWSPDEETLALLTKEKNLILLLRYFDPICEKHLNPEDIKVADSKHVSVGWGKEETQFKGKGFKALEREREALKYAGLDLKEDSPMRDPTVAELEKGTLSNFDSGLFSISWRGDCEFFAVSTVEDVEAQESYSRRVIRVFSREGELDSISEAVDGLEHNLAWRPSGSLVASTQRFTDSDGDDVLNVAFYERNGLRHGEFNTRLNPYEEQIVNIEWSANSDVMAFHTNTCVRVWATKNYHWYLKQEIFVNDLNPDNQISYIKFHPEKPLHLMVGTTMDGVYMLNFAYKIASGPTVATMDVGMTAVIDGQDLKITPLAIANVPPPIAFREYELLDNALDVAVSSTNEKFAVLTSRHDVQIHSIGLEDMKNGGTRAMDVIEKQVLSLDSELVKQVAFIQDSVVAVLVDTASSSKVVLVDVDNRDIPVGEVELECRAVLIKSRSDMKKAVVECVNGSIYEISDIAVATYISTFPQLSHDFEVAVIKSDLEETALPIGISSNGKLMGGDKQLATAVTSLKVTDTLLAFTTAHSQVCFVHLSSAFEPEKFAFLQNNNDATDERIRQIERGSILVSCVPSKYSVVLQAPRGNLETICPRIMVLTGVRKFIKEKKYYNAFIACRTHRIDLDLLHDYDREQFYNNAELFVNQIKNVDYLDLFVSCLKNEDVSVTKYKDTLEGDEIVPQMSNLAIAQVLEKPTARKMIINKVVEEGSSKVNHICNAILAVLSQPKFEVEYLQTRVTAFACQKPPNLAGALKLISSLSREDEQELALTHLCFLLDVNKLYNHALELYDVKLALNIAQKSQKDPKEYLPFLQNLHIQPQLRKQFLIDDHLKYHEKAMNWLFELGQEAISEFDHYVVKHELYKHALSIYKYDSERTKEILAFYADFLHDNGKFVKAAVTFEYLENFRSALESYISGKRWKEALSIAPKFGAETLESTAQKLSSVLVEDHKYAEAAEIELRYLHNIEEAVRLFCKSYQFDSAILLAIEQSKPELIDSVVDVQLGEGFGTITELVADCKSQANSQLRRLRELRQKKEEDPYAFYGIPNDDLDTPDNVSVAASETSTTPSFFTKYTGKTSGTAKTGASRRTAKNRKREERKRAKGRKGTIYEEEYLIKSVGRLVERLDQTQSDASNLIEGLLRRQMIPQAYHIQSNWVELTEFLKEHIVEIHSMSERDRERIDDNGEVYLIDEIPPPVIKDFAKMDILDY